MSWWRLVAVLGLSFRVLTCRGGGWEGDIEGWTMVVVVVVVMMMIDAHHTGLCVNKSRDMTQFAEQNT